MKTHAARFQSQSSLADLDSNIKPEEGAKVVVNKNLSMTDALVEEENNDLLQERLNEVGSV